MSSSHRPDTPIILHALYNPHQPFSLILFGEAGESGSIPISEKKDSEPHHPFASSAEHLSNLIKFNLQQGTEQPATTNNLYKIEFPTAKGEIVASPEFISQHGIEQREPDSSAFFQVPVVVCQSEHLFHLPEGNPSSWIDGGSLRFWRGCASLAREMVIRGRYLPSSGIYQNGGVCTRWKLISSSYDEHRIASLARAMPPIQQNFLRYAEGSKLTGRKDAVILFIESIIARIIFLTTQTNPEDLITNFTPIERLKYSQELTALYYLQGIRKAQDADHESADHQRMEREI